MRTRITRLLNALTLLGIGGVLILFFVSGRLDHYLHPLFRPGVLAAGILFLGFGLVYGLSNNSAECCIDQECLHPNTRRPLQGLLAFGVLVVPLISGTVFSKDSYDATAVLNRGFVQDVTKLPGRKPELPNPPPVIPSQALGGDIDGVASAPAVSGNTINGQGTGQSAAPASRYEPPLPQDNQGGTSDPASPDSPDSTDYLPTGPDGNVSLQVTDLLYGEAEESIRKAFTGKKIEVLGQYLGGKSAGQFKLVRMFIVCCAADARPVALPVVTSPEYRGTDMSWVKVIGTPVYKVNEANGSATVTFHAEKVEPADPPEDAMLY